MTHLLENHCRIVDVDGEVTRWGHVGIDLDPILPEMNTTRSCIVGDIGGTLDPSALPQAPLRASLMLLPDLLIAHHITGNEHYRDFYRSRCGTVQGQSGTIPPQSSGVSDEGTSTANRTTVRRARPTRRSTI